MRTLLTLTLLMLLAAACGGSGSDGPTAPSGSGSSGGPDGSGGSGNCAALRSGIFSATIDGSPWSADDTLPVGGLLAAEETLGGQTLFAIGGNSCDDIAFGFAIPASVGTRTVGDGSGTNAEYAEGARNSATPRTWAAIFGLGGSGTVVVNTYSTTRVSGTFSFTLVPSSGGATGTVRVT